MTKLKAGVGRLGKFAAAHKKALALLALLLAAGAAILIWRGRAGRGLPVSGTAAGGKSYVRTVTLQKGTLDDSISASGTVASDDVSNVTTELKYTVKSVNVQVGDSVNAGDVICTLDTADLEKSIAKAKESIAEAKEKALKTYTNAQTALTEAEQNVKDAYDAKEEKKSARDSAKSAYESAVAKIAAYQTAYDSANAELLAKLNAQQSAQSGLASAQAVYDAALSSKKAELKANDPDDALYATDEALTLAAETELSSSAEKAALDSAAAAKTVADDAYKAAEEALAVAEANLRTAKTSTNYDALQAAYTQAQATYEQAKTAYEQAQKASENAETTRNDALDAYNKAGSSDELEDLQQQLEKCTLTAETSGKVTAVNATVGSAITGAAATIQNTDKLKIAISIAEYDIESVKVGMKAIITSDVIDGQVTGTLTQISPTASGGGSSSSTFAAEVTVDGTDTGLLVGTNAKVQIVVSTTENVFTVPLDAIGENESGAKIIYVKDGEDADGQPTFKEVEVTVGAENDYYAEISGAELEEGMIVRAAANESEATDTMDRVQMGGMMGGDVQVSTVWDAAPGGGHDGGGGGGMAAPAMGG